MARSLDGVRVLQLGSSPAGRAAAAYLESQGASVVAGLDLDNVDVVIADSPDSSLATAVGRDDVVVLDVSPFGASGPWARFEATEYSVAAATGLSELTGPPDGPPTLLASETLPAGDLGALAIVAALDERRRTGKGRRIQLSELDAALPALWTAVLDWTVNGREQERLGARDPETAPHGVYRCRDGNWLAIACYSDEEWYGLKVALGRPDWCELERMQTRASRLLEQRGIDHHISHWINEQTRRPDEPPTLVITMMDNLEVPRYTSHEMARYFQKFGVPAAVVERREAPSGDSNSTAAPRAT